MNPLRAWKRKDFRPPLSPFEIHSAGRTHVGLVRPINEDRLLNCPERCLWAVADGMGGHSGGGDAAATVIHRLAALSSSGQSIGIPCITTALHEANAAIFEGGRKAGRVSGSTVAGLHMDQGRYTVFWAGDSRVYRLRAGHLQCLTRDHSLVQEMLDAKALTEQQARNHPKSNVITRALGVDPDVDIEFVTGEIADPDFYLICSDGLFRDVDDTVLGSKLTVNLDQIIGDLIDCALDAGGNDNISVIFVSAK